MKNTYAEQKQYIKDLKEIISRTRRELEEAETHALNLLVKECSLYNHFINAPDWWRAKFIYRYFQKGDISRVGEPHLTIPARAAVFRDIEMGFSMDEIEKSLESIGVVFIEEGNSILEHGGVFGFLQKSDKNKLFLNEILNEKFASYLISDGSTDGMRSIEWHDYEKTINSYGYHKIDFIAFEPDLIKKAWEECGYEIDTSSVFSVKLSW